MAVENIAKALGDESRRKIIELLKEGELPATAIFDQFEYAAPTISRHLSVLKDAGLVLHFLVQFLQIFDVLGQLAGARLGISIGIDRDRGNAQLPAGFHHPAGDLAAIGDQDFLEHALTR